jgi:hypothetical protein
LPARRFSASSRARTAQASVRRHDASAWRGATGHGGHSSSTIATSTPSAACIRTTPSGVKRRAAPSRWLRKVTPPSSTLRSPSRLKTWKPPLSVRIGRRQPVKA